MSRQSFLLFTLIYFLFYTDCDANTCNRTCIYYAGTGRVYLPTVQDVSLLRRHRTYFLSVGTGCVSTLLVKARISSAGKGHRPVEDCHAYFPSEQHVFLLRRYRTCFYSVGKGRVFTPSAQDVYLLRINN